MEAALRGRVLGRGGGRWEREVGQALRKQVTLEMQESLEIQET